ncbi:MULTISPECIES: response regulator transcription factor [Arsenicicoccus]|uniref:response regulator transcription factor n=1 Tax=Arsenicicoccus TaxID=267408 RepID=UPI00257A68B4|nr:MULTISPECIES: response regulator transcription factor [Arsenicicoccus]
MSLGSGTAQPVARGGTPPRPRVLVVEDEPAIARVVAGYLEREGFEVAVAGEGHAALDLARDREPDVVVLDLMLPGIDGLEVCRRLRTFSDAYVIMLTARTEELDRVIGLSTGADDYVTKPFSAPELVARVRAMLRRPRAGTARDEPVRRVGDLTIDPVTREALRGGQRLELTRTEFDLLDVLTERPGHVLSRDQIFEQVWGGQWFGDRHVVDVHVANLRRKLGDDAQSPRYIRTVRGFGYGMGAGT